MLITGRPSWTGFLCTSSAGWVASARQRAGDAGWAEYLGLMSPFDADQHIAALDPARIYLQYGANDTVVPRPVWEPFINLLLDARAKGRALAGPQPGRRTGAGEQHRGTLKLGSAALYSASAGRAALNDPPRLANPPHRSGVGSRETHRRKPRHGAAFGGRDA